MNARIALCLVVGSLAACGSEVTLGTGNAPLGGADSDPAITGPSTPSGTTPAPATPGGPSTCGASEHTCSGACVSSTSVATCGTLCTPCVAPANGASTCNGTTCGFTCNAGYGALLTSCAPKGWSTVKPLAFPRSQLAAALGGDGRIYAIGGSAPGIVTTVEAYTPATDTWAPVAPLTLPRVGPAAVRGPDGRVYAIGGASGVNAIEGSVEAYTPATDTWAPVAPMQARRVDPAAVLGKDGRIYVIGGFNLDNVISGDPSSVCLNSAEVYTLATNTWTTLAPLPSHRTNLTAAVGPDGRIYVAGGTVAANDYPGDAFVYTPSTNTWATIASMTGRSGSRAATGPDGLIYVIGGQKAAAPWTLSQVEAFSPKTNAWTAAASMQLERYNHATAVDSDGRIYALGGRTLQDVVTGVVEVFVP